MKKTGGRYLEISRTRKFIGLRPKYWSLQVASGEVARRQEPFI
jgi:hypothetical protein